MNEIRKNRVRLGVESLEGRELLATGLIALPSSAAALVRGRATPRPEAAVAVNDLRNSAFAGRLRGYLNQLAQGNEGSGSVERLTVDADGNVSGELRVLHRHVAGSFFGQKIVVYDLTQRASFDFNVREGVADVSLDLGRGVRVGTKQIRDMLDVFSVKRGNEYKRIRDSYYKKHGQANVYFASKGFVDWAGPETAGRWVVTAVASGGSASLAQASQEARDRVRAELPRILNFLRSRGIREAGAVGERLLAGQSLRVPKLNLKWQTVAYTTTLEVAEVSLPSVKLRHAAFALVWSGGNVRR